MKKKTRYFILGAIVMISLTSLAIADYYSDENYIQKLLPKFLNPTTEFASMDLSDSRLIGYEYLDSFGNVVGESEGDTIHTWNTKHDYYFNKSSGIQLTNHFQDYWTRNIFCGGYKNSSNEWVYKCNDALPFDWNIETDNLTYINYTGFRDVTIENKEVRVAVRYHLKVDDEELTVQFKIKNIGTSDINTDLGFAWRTTDINISGQEDDSIIVNGTKYLLNQELNNTYTNLAQTIYFLQDFSGENLWLSWNENLTYALQVKSQDGQYNAPVTLGINIGTLSIGQEKSTEMFWLDADAQFGRPNNDFYTVNWSSTNATYYESVDEVTSNGDNDYVYSGIDEAVLILNISDLTDPEINSGHILQFVAKAAGSSQVEKAQMSLFQNSTEIASTDSVYIDRGTYETVVYTLTSEEADGISDYTDLSLRMYVRQISEGETMRVSQMEFQVPLAPTEVIPSLSLESPKNNTAFNVSTINFTALVTDNGIIKNVSLYIDGVLNVTNSTEINPLPIGTYTGTSFDTAGSGNTAPNGITDYNDFFWISDSDNDLVYKYFTNGTYTGTTFDLNSSGNNNPTGIIDYDGFFWIPDSIDDVVYKYFTNGTYTETTFDTNESGNTNPQGIMEYNDFFWIVDGIGNNVYKYFTNGTYADETFDTAISGNGVPRGITYYGGFLWITDLTDDEIYRYFTNGTYTNESFDTFSDGNEQPQGIIDYDNFFWITSQAVDEVYKYETGFVRYEFNDIPLADGIHNWTVESYDTINSLGTTDTWNFSISTAEEEEDCWTDITGGIYVPSGCTYYIPDSAYIT